MSIWASLSTAHTYPTGIACVAVSRHKLQWREAFSTHCSPFPKADGSQMTRLEDNFTEMPGVVTTGEVQNTGTRELRPLSF